MAIPYCDRQSLELLKKQKDVNFFLDSGAFTAWKVGKETSLDEYCAFVKGLPFEPFGYFTLDKIGDPVGTRRNFDAILKRGLKPIPIFTRGSDWKELDMWFKHSDVVGVGGGTGTPGFPLFIRDASRHVEKTRRKIHWLGFTDKDFIARWRPFSCDSSSSNNAIKYGNLLVYLGHGRMKFVHRSKFREDPAKTCALVRPWVDWCGEDLYALKEDAGWKLGGVADTITGKAWAKYMIDCEVNFGTKVFTAIGNLTQLQKSLETWHFCVERSLKFGQVL